eukprot:TRINITY_DN23377_c0_g1_i1.p2 TRINITY_DN23377_c0_g1~~TRINITY_DN23377_c0_g1_i1.p2  ORF type:complete len:449 (+),score=109.44 TRINITY_DN23377_c0_g1_i1:113-1348(+)
MAAEVLNPEEAPLLEHEDKAVGPDAKGVLANAFRAQIPGRQACKHGAILAVSLLTTSLFFDWLRYDTDMFADQGVGRKPLAPQAEEIVEAKHGNLTVSEYVLNPYAVCDTSHLFFTMQPVYITSIRCTLNALVFGILSAIPSKGYADSIGTLGALWLFVNFCMVVKALVNDLFIVDLPALADATWFARMGLRVWLSMVDPGYSSMAVISATCNMAVAAENNRGGGINGPIAQGVVKIINGGNQVFSAVYLIMSIPFTFPQIFLWIISLFCSIFSLEWWGMFLACTIDLVLPVVIIGGCAMALVKAITGNEDRAATWMYAKAMVLLAAVTVCFSTDLMARQLLHLYSEHGNCETHVMVYKSRQSCAWRDCVLAAVNHGSYTMQLAHRFIGYFNFSLPMCSFVSLVMTCFKGA